MAEFLLSVFVKLKYALRSSSAGFRQQSCFTSICQL